MDHGSLAIPRPLGFGRDGGRGGRSLVAVAEEKRPLREVYKKGPHGFQEFFQDFWRPPHAPRAHICHALSSISMAWINSKDSIFISTKDRFLFFPATRVVPRCAPPFMNVHGLSPHIYFLRHGICIAYRLGSLHYLLSLLAFQHCLNVHFSTFKLVLRHPVSKNHGTVLKMLQN